MVTEIDDNVNNSDITDALDLLEKTLNDDIFKITIPDINIDKLLFLDEIKKQNNYIDDNKKQTSLSNTSNSTSETTVPDDSITIKEVNIPSDLFNNDSNKNLKNSESHNNIAFAKQDKQCIDDMDDIIDL